MWKENLFTFSEKFNHPAWGLSHYRRVYELSLYLAQQQGMTMDEDALLAAAYLHDMGAFQPYRQAGIDHAERSTQVIESILVSIGFPNEKVSLVKEIVQGHMFYANPTSRHEAILFHDADTLDFLGIIGITRLLSIVGLDDWTPDLPSAVNQIKRFSEELPSKLLTPAAQKLGAARQAEMISYLQALSSETKGFEML